MKRFLPFLLLLCLSTAGWSETYKDWSTTNVSQDDGDTIATSQALTSCTSNCLGTPLVLSAAITSRGNRRRTFCNTAAFEVYLGTASATNTLTTQGFRIHASTGTVPCFTTYSTAAFYGQSIGASSATVTIIQEKVAAP